MNKAPNNQIVRKEEGIWSKTLRRTWLQFSASTTIHGVQYISGPRSNNFSRIIWIMIPICCFITANVLVGTFWMRYKSNPTRINVESNHAPIHELDFPAITFCSANRASEIRARALIKKLVLPSNVTVDMFLDYLWNTCGFTHKWPHYHKDEIDIMQDIFFSNRYDVQTIMYELMQPCEQLLYRCRWEGNDEDCMKLFKKSLTYQGYCCSFNLIKPDDTISKPQRTSYFDVKDGLSVVLQPLVDAHSISSVFSQGVKLMVHESRVYPSDTCTEKMLPLRSETLARIKTEITYCSREVQKLSIDDRDCALEDEFPLKYFSFYHESNCDTECRMSKILQLCGCVPYYLATGKASNIVCNFTKIPCLIDHYDDYHGSNVFGNSTFTSVCPSQCNNKFYDVQVSSVPLINFNFSIDPFYQDLNESHMIVHLYFGNQVYTKLRRDLLSNYIGLISSLGGVYSLFIGMSVLSFFEIFYFSTIRLYQNYKYYKYPERYCSEHNAEVDAAVRESSNRLKWNEIINLQN